MISENLFQKMKLSFVDISYRAWRWIQVYVKQKTMKIIELIECECD